MTEETTAGRFSSRLRSLEAQLGLVLLLLVLLPTFLVAWFAYDYTVDITRTDRIRTVGRVADARHEQLTMLFTRARNRAEDLLADLNRHCGSHAGSPECFRQGINSFMHSEGAIGLAFSAPGSFGLTMGRSAVMAGAIPDFKTGQLAQFTKRGEGSGRDYFVMASDPQGKLRLAVTYSVDAIQPVFVSHPDLGSSGETFLADDQGFFITSARYPATQGHSHPISATPMRRCLTPESGETLDLDYRDVPIIHGFRFIPETGGGCIMAHVDQAEAFAPLSALKNTFLAAMLGLAIAAVLAAMYLARRLTRPIRELTRVTGAIADGNHALRAVSTDYKEITELATAFNAMTDELVTTNATLEQRVLERTESLRASEERWQFALEGAGDGVWDWSLDSGEIIFSRGYQEMLGYADGVQWNCLDDWKSHVNPEEMKTAMVSLESYLDGKIPSYSAEYRMRCADGGWKWLLARGKVVSRAADGRPLRLIGTHADITERKEAEAALQASESRFRSIFENANTGIAATDSSGRVSSFNEAFRVMLDYDAESLGGMSFRDFTHPDDLDLENEFFSEILAGQRQHYRITKRYINRDGETLWVDISVSAIRDAYGKVANFIGVIQNITESMEAEQALRDGDETLRGILETTLDGYWCADEQGRLLDVNPAYCGQSGYTRDELLEMGISDLDAKESPAETAAHIRQLIEDGNALFESRHRRKDGSIWDVEVSATSRKIAGGQLFVFLRDITERKLIEDQVRHLAFYDPLTQLPNRRLLFDRLNQAMAISKRSGCYGAVMFLDLDNFKPLNDRYGHAIGDLLLIEAATRLKDCVREMDTVARFGGDEFVVIISELNTDRIASTAEAKIIAEKIGGALAEPYRLTRRTEGESVTTIEHHCAASIGVTVFLDHEASQDDILKWADSAMYEAKEAGRNSIRFYDSET